MMLRRKRERNGGALLEAALFLPVLAMVLFGVIELSRLGWVYFTLQKGMETIGRYAATQIGANLCDDGDPIITEAKNLAITGTPDASVDPVLPNLQASQIQVRLERYNTDSATLDECTCSSDGCDVSQGGRPPDFVVVSMPDGYSYRLAIPFISLDAFLLRPHARVPVKGI